VLVYLSRATTDYYRDDIFYMSDNPKKQCQSTEGRKTPSE